MSLAEIVGVDAFRATAQVLHGVRLTVGFGETVGLVGRNGMGKTSLLHLLIGFLRPRRGHVTVGGTDLATLPVEQIARLGVTLVPQGRRVFSSLTVGEHLRVAYRPGGTGGWTPDEVTDRFPVLRDLWPRKAGTLSGGEQQVLAVGRGLVGNGRLVLLDEPGVGLDHANLSALAGAIRDLPRRGGGALFFG
jgi:branched-chain amino acid transport system ATP-binding protein